jgi:PIN domain nuclease of toxin-antitoxin system
VILLDTHVLLWIDRDDACLGHSSRGMIEAAWSEGAVVVSAISFWEVAMLAIRGRLELPCDVNLWRSNWLEAGLREMPIDGSIALGAVSLVAFHPDPADRFLVATALGIRATLLTADQAILRWTGPLTRHNART